MTGELDHLQPQFRAIAAKSADERIDWIRQDRWIHYLRADQALKQLDELLAFPPRTRMPCLLLTGAPGMGKTHIIQKFVRDHPPVFDEIRGTTRVPVVAMQMPPEPLEQDFYEEFLMALGAVISTGLSIISVRSRARKFARQFGMRMLIIDEIHSMLAGTFRQQRRFLNSLRFLANDLHLPIVCVGIHEAYQALTTDQQLADRFGEFELPPWRNDASFAQLLKTFGADVDIRDRDFREITRDLSRKLAAGRPYLWIVDDLPPGLDQQQEFPGWCAPSTNGCTLITTRERDYEGIGATIEIDVLDPAPALELMTQERKPQSEQELRDAKDLAEELGRHALVLDVAGHFLLKTKTFAELRDEVIGSWSDPLGELAAGLTGQLPGGHEKSIVATLVASVRLLGEQGLSLLRLASVLDGGTPVPLRLAKGVFRRAFGLEEAAAGDYLTLAVNQSEMHSLATVSFGGGGSDVFSVHSLVRYTVLHGDPARGQAPALRQTLRGAAVVVLVEVLENVGDIRKHASLAMEIAHARHIAPQPGTEGEALLWTLLASYEGVRGNYREALAATKKALPIREPVGPDHLATLTNRYNIATWTGRAGDAREALRLFRELLPDEGRVLGPDHPSTLKTRCSIAAWTGETGDAREALRLFRDLLLEQERVLGPCDRDTLATRNNIAFWTGETGDARQALRLFRVLLADLEEVLGADHADTLATRNNIAAWTGRTGDAREALRLNRELLSDEKRVLGPDHPDTLTTRNNIASWTGETGDAREALRLFQELLPDEERVLGPDHPDTLATRHNIAFWTGETGAAREALRLFRDLLLEQERVLGPCDRDTLATRNNIAFWTERA